MLAPRRDNPAVAALTESRDQIASLSEFLCREGLWSEREAQRVIAETKNSFAPTLAKATL